MAMMNIEIHDFPQKATEMNPMFISVQLAEGFFFLPTV